jgi:hypothetical protein
VLLVLLVEVRVEILVRDRLFAHGSLQQMTIALPALFRQKNVKRFSSPARRPRCHCATTTTTTTTMAEAASMPTNKIGDMEVSAIALGCFAFGGDHQTGSHLGGAFAALHDGLWGEQPEEDTFATVKAALAAGINFFDNAEMYGGGYAEEVTGRARFLVLLLAHHSHLLLLVAGDGARAARVGLPARRVPHRHQGVGEQPRTGSAARALRGVDRTAGLRVHRPVPAALEVGGGAAHGQVPGPAAGTSRISRIWLSRFSTNAH